ncbi:hypothetical protein AM493_18685 [Flavobacterium akiainvivens]|uniref:Lipoprotein n=1 Tax=Flavobacterium akiainvivens TaxID=1202724 RepID=A0A0M8MKS3_9FLAO|nr:hypothetical protein [Flavobacterium akiainvivens]KOS07857.1 hypothetical protein AM493_18685 [Flavobacterium akiainvivens]SFQ27631.1 hypothetical protein SAMN05444144_102318 [Flavobacterium akiainvivens]
MKKLLLFVPFLSLFVACSADTDTEELANYKTSYSPAREMLVSEFPSDGALNTSCVKKLSAAASLKTTNGPGTGTLTFTAQVTNSPSGNYKARVEIQQLSDCDDFNSTTGNAVAFTNDVIYSNIGTNAPQVTGVSPSATFACYKWRLVIEGVSNSGSVTCNSKTAWYDAPLF